MGLPRRWIIIVAFVGFLILSGGILYLNGTNKVMTEEERIEVWIEKNNLNTYGDPKDSAYAGGTPLFDESTGEYIDKYEYIKERHPDAPWNK